MMVLFGIILGIAWFICKQYEEKQYYIRNCGVDIRKPESRWTAEEKAAYKRKSAERAISKAENLTQETRRHNEYGMKKIMVEQGIDSIPVELASQRLRKDNTTPSLETFQQVADLLPSHLGDELMRSARIESTASARRFAVNQVGGIGNINELEAIKEDKAAKEALYAVVDKCQAYSANKGIVDINTPVTATSYSKPDNNLFS